MSEAGAMASSSPGLVPPRGEPEAATEAERAIRPPWLRPAATVVAAAFHLALAAFVAVTVAPLVSLDGIDVTLVPLGDSAEDKPHIDEVKEAEAPAPAPAAQEAPQPETPPVPAQPTPPADAVPELSAPPPRVVAPEAVPLPVASPLPKPLEKPKKKVVVEKEEDVSPTLAELREQRRRQAEAADRRKAQAGQQASHRGSPRGQAQASGMSRGDYAALLAAEVARHKVYPAAARAAQATGSVGVTFTVGASGRVVSHSITRSSGNSLLDGAVHAIMAAVHAPPPPGGVFRSSTTINFSLH